MITAGAAPALANNLSVSPTRVIVPKANQSTLTVKADGNEQSIVQVRVMEWKEGTAPDRLKKTRNVVISPPVAQLRPRQELTVRIVRTKKRAVRGRECYRVLVDRLPGKEQSGQAVKLQVRHSVPLCFTS
tara:strand:- start:19421 stop:19810 length:390 start_codon:yes stop_codon:yes gene_type:complete